MAKKWGLTRSDCDEFGKLSQDSGARAWEEGRFESQIIPIEVKPDEGDPIVHQRDEGLRATTLEALAQLSALSDDAVHTAGSTSQIADGASALLLMRRSRATELGLEPLATIVDACLVGCDPVLMLEGPIPATRTLLDRNGLTIADLDVVEINEAFASVVLSWMRELQPDPEIVNPNGGAIALGHPLGATGVSLIAKAAHELARSDQELGLVTMCCGGGLGTGTLLRRG
jgi:acetyl-CoA C-acetyltransferase